MLCMCAHVCMYVRVSDVDARQGWTWAGLSFRNGRFDVCAPFQRTTRAV